MELFVDDQKFDAATPADAALADVLESVKRATGESGRIIVSIACDGIDVAGDTFSETLKQPANTHRRIDMHTANPDELVDQALDTARELLDASEEATQQVVDLLAQGKPGVGLPRLAECCQAWLQVHEGICNAMVMLSLEPEHIDLGGKRLAALLAEPLEQLKRLKETVESGDHVLLGDILTYEFPEAIKAWRQLLDAVSAHTPMAPAR